MIKIEIKRVLLAMATILTSLNISSCGYEDYTGDFDYTTIYYGSQKPYRTLIIRDVDGDNDDARRASLTFKSGVVVGGILENTKGYWADFIIDETLFQSVDGADQFTLLPENCYTMECTDNRIFIPAGELLGDFSISIKDELFDLPDFDSSIYALPFRLVDISADRYVDGKDYTIIAFKFQLETEGDYYAVGVQQQYTSGSVTQTINYPGDEINSDELIRTLTTADLNTLTMNFMGYVNPAEDKDKVALQFDDEGSVSLKKWSDLYGGTTNALRNASEHIITYNNSSDERSFTLQYSYWRDDLRYDVVETLTQRQDPELAIRYAEW